MADSLSNQTGDIYSATYSGIPVYEFQFGLDRKEHVMRRRGDDYINATHILKAAGFDKPARTRVLEREVQKGTHEKVQGGYGKYQGTWVPLEIGRQLALQNQCFDKLQPIFDFIPGPDTPPPAPRHASKPKQPKLRTGPKLSARTPASVEAVHDRMAIDEDTPDNATIASAVSERIDEDDRFDPPQSSTGHRRRQNMSILNRQDITQQEHATYAHALLDYFLLSGTNSSSTFPEPPLNFNPGMEVDDQGNTPLHWAASMGDLAVVIQLIRFGASVNARNIEGQTPLMRTVMFNNCYEKSTFKEILNHLFDETYKLQDNAGHTVLHHAAYFKDGRITGQTCSRLYLQVILNKLINTLDEEGVHRYIDTQDRLGNTALHLAAIKQRSKCVRTLLSHGASTDIGNYEGVTADEMIKEINATRTARVPDLSSSPFAPPPERHDLVRNLPNLSLDYNSEAAKQFTSLFPSFVDKCKEVANSYEAELKEKDQALDEVRTRHDKAQDELKTLTERLLVEEGQLDPEDVAAEIEANAELAKAQFLEVLSHKNRRLIHSMMHTNLTMNKVDHNGVQDQASHDETQATIGNHLPQQRHRQEDTAAEQLELAAELSQLTRELRVQEDQYAEALAAVGSDNKVEQYQNLLKLVLGEEMALNLREDDLDILIQELEGEN